MKTLTRIGFLSLLPIVTLGWNPAARSETLAPPARSSEARPPAPQDARDLAAYVYLHVTRNRGISMQDAARASTCRATSRNVRS